MCRDGACEFFCENDDACDDLQLCQEGACVDVECRQDAQCADGVCLENACVQCRESADCAERECAGGACVCAANACVQCGNDEDCGEGRCNADNLCVECIVSADCADGSICLNDACAAPPEGGGICEAPVEYSLGEVLRGTIADGLSRDTAVGCLQAGAGPEKVHRFTVDAAGPVCLQTRGSNFDTALYVRSAACLGPDSVEVACNDNSAFAGGFQSSLNFEAEAGVEYFVIVDSFFAEVAAEASTTG